MNAHSCQRCSHIIIDLPDHSQIDDESVESTMVFDIAAVKDAVQNGCKFFQWALAVDKGLLKMDTGEYLDAHISDLPGPYLGVDKSEDESSSRSDGTYERREDEACEELLQLEETSIDQGEDFRGMYTESGTEMNLLSHARSTSVKVDTSKSGMCKASESEEPHLELHLYCWVSWHGRYHLKRDITRSDKESAEPRYNFSWKGAELEFVALDGSALRKHIKTRPIAQCPSSPESFNLVRSWIENCTKQHSHGHTCEADRLPARLLKVGFTKDGCLHACIVSTTEPVTYHYIALSYRWGGDQDHKTTTKTMSETGGVVEVSRLPTTIRDAIMVTLKAGYSYLWVDSVCIIQDDDHDRTVEIAKMPDIYSYAVCTITASFPADAWEGFLSDRVQYTQHILEIRVRHTSDDEDREVRTLHAYPIEYEDTLVEEPLAERGWALQERLLSIRVLEYRRNQVHFLCPFTDEDEGTFSDGWTRDWPQNGQIWIPKDADGHAPKTLLGWDISSAKDFKKIWDSIVEAYTARSLTFVADRTLAISGIAQRMATMDRSGSSNTYIAGHWLSYFPFDLLWYTPAADWTHNQRHLRRCPTWAWTSTDTRVDAAYGGSHHPPRSAVKLVDYTVKLRDIAAPFGDVDYAALTIEGRMAMADCRITDNYIPRKTELHFKDTWAQFGMVWLDAMTGPEDRDHIQDVTLLLTETSGTGEKSFTAEGLVVVEESSDDDRRRFSRAGCWSAAEHLDDDQEGTMQERILQLFYDSELITFDLI